jgi:hypothetical protein
LWAIFAVTYVYKQIFQDTNENLEHSDLSKFSSGRGHSRTLGIWSTLIGLKLYVGRINDSVVNQSDIYI